jgi:DNA-binding transcriptional LysR family regulator
VTKPPLARVDLNLLVVLSHLLGTRSVARTAVALGLTASAVSHALARLRKTLDDDLFVRSREGLMPTARALALQPILDDTLGKLTEALAGVRFDPRAAGLTFQLATADFGARATLPRLLRELSEQAPGIELVIRPLPTDTLAALESGELDAMVGMFQRPQPSLYKRGLFADHMVVAARRGHPAIRRGRVTLTDYLAHGHVQISPRGLPGSPLDSKLRELGHSRRIAVRVPDFLIAPLLVAETDLLVSASRLLLKGFEKLLPLELAPLPIDVAPSHVSLVWHARSHQEPAHQWMRELLVRVYTETFRDA